MLARGGWSASTWLTPKPTKLVLMALEQVLTLRQPAPGLVIYTNRGNQYTSLACCQRITDDGALGSYAGRLCPPYDNAQTEVGEAP